MHNLIGNCRSCGYSLLRLTQPRCPECGTPFDPQDPRTMILHHSPLAAFLSRKITLWTIAPSLLAATAALALHIYAPAAPGTLALQITAALIVAATLYLLMARRKFRAFLHKRQREADALMRHKS